MKSQTLSSFIVDINAALATITVADVKTSGVGLTSAIKNKINSLLVDTNLYVDGLRLKYNDDD